MELSFIETYGADQLSIFRQQKDLVQSDVSKLLLSGENKEATHRLLRFLIKNGTRPELTDEHRQMLILGCNRPYASKGKVERARKAARDWEGMKDFIDKFVKPWMDFFQTNQFRRNEKCILKRFLQEYTATNRVLILGHNDDALELLYVAGNIRSIEVPFPSSFIFFPLTMLHL